MRRFPLFAILLLLVAAIMFNACGGGTATTPDAVDTPELYGKSDIGKGAAALPPADTDPDWTWDLIAGQHDYVGTVAVWNSDTTIYVTYDLFDGYMMDEAHVLASATMPGPKEGNPGRFTAKMEFDEPLDSYTFEIPLSSVSGLSYKADLYMATHATTTDGETMWGGDWDGTAGSWDFEWKKWGGGFMTNVMPYYDLPDGPVPYKAYHWGFESYWRVYFIGNPAFDFPGANPWVGWCADKYHVMYPGQVYDITVVSTYDQTQTKTASSLEDRMHSDNWDLINYMINQRRAGEGIYDVNWGSNTYRQAFQDAIWYLKDGVVPGSSSYAWNFIDDAALNGEDYIPGPGDWFALILYPAGGSQMNIIEVDP